MNIDHFPIGTVPLANQPVGVYVRDITIYITIISRGCYMNNGGA